MSQQTARIVRDLHDEPHIEGRRITVQFVAERVEEQGLDPQTLGDRHDLDVAAIYHALAYYHDHPEEMREVERRRQSNVDEHESLTTAPEDVR